MRRTPILQRQKRRPTGSSLPNPKRMMKVTHQADEAGTDSSGMVMHSKKKKTVVNPRYLRSDRSKGRSIESSGRLVIDSAPTFRH